MNCSFVVLHPRTPRVVVNGRRGSRFAGDDYDTRPSTVHAGSMGVTRKRPDPHALTQASFPRRRHGGPLRRKVPVRRLRRRLRRQVSWLMGTAGAVLRRTLPAALAPGLPGFPVAWINGRSLPTYSCGGSRGFVGSAELPRSLLRPRREPSLTTTNTRLRQPCQAPGPWNSGVSTLPGPQAKIPHWC